MRKTGFVGLSILVCFSAGVCVFNIGCRQRSKSDEVLEKQTEGLMREANSKVGMPAITNFQERQLAKEIFELRDQSDLVCYAYIVSLHGKLVFIGKCIGFGLPYSIQFTNPVKIERIYQGEYEPVPQVDPNGLFMPDGLSATWLMMYDGDNQVKPVYLEPEIVVSPFPMTPETPGYKVKAPK